MSKKIYKYLLILLLTFFFTYIFELKELYILLYILFFIPLIDIISLKIFLSKIEGDIIINDSNYTMQDLINFQLCITNKSFFQINNVSINILFEGCINNDKTCINDISIERKNNFFLEQSFKAIHIGNVIIKFESISIKGLFGLFKSNLIINKDKIINIEPRVVDIIGYNKLLYNSNYKEGYGFNNKELAGELDTEYKNYEIGEPVNKINWKISSKKQKLLMRKNIQNYKKDKIVLVLDTYISRGSSYYSERDKLIESFLGLVNKYYKDKFQVHIYIYSSIKFKKIEVNNDTQFNKLKKLLASYDYSDEYISFEKFQLNVDNSNYVIVTSSINNIRKVMFDNVSRYANKICIMCTNNYESKQRKVSNFFDIYYIDDNFNL